ncbi:flagellar basal body rod protein FlgC [Terriglobus tenax]|uniref:flagellar basal body rod protein FlgC n=1 Tax=Terriglobus tenax TaxID=1111115 RepID=UPI0021E0CFE3|nr:flagellar basal body rod protein FlgC [Terriglobus tenax]
MNLFGVMDISASALQAERVRAEVTASNMANAETTRTAEGGPYRRQQVVFQTQGQETNFGSSLMAHLGSNTIGGVEIAGVQDDAKAPVMRFDPGHPDANANGYVAYPDIDPLTEMVDLMSAQRSYGMNASAVQAEKNMITSSLDILK